VGLSTPVMRTNFQLLLILCLLVTAAHAQDDLPPSINLGDNAPPLMVRTWLKGEPVQQFEKGKIYVVEFWATWCIPCKAAMPHISELAGEYKDRVNFIGIDVYETKTNSLEKIKKLVDSMGRQIDFPVATEDSNFMVTNWLIATGERREGIPRTFIVNQEGKLAWIGYPKNLGEILPKIVNNDWDIKDAKSKRDSRRYLEDFNDSVNTELMLFSGNTEKQGDPGQPYSALSMIDKLVASDPRLE